MLGVILTNDLKWFENTTHVCSKVNRKLFIISKLKHFGFQKEELLKAWVSILRPNTEYAVPLWHSGLSLFDSNRLEKLQKRVLGIILGTTYIENKRYYNVENKHLSYDETLQKLGLTSLTIRREVLTNKFALDSLQNVKHKDMFIEKVPHNINTRSKCTINEIACKTQRYYKSAVPYMSRILNCILLPKK